MGCADSPDGYQSLQLVARALSVLRCDGAWLCQRVSTTTVIASLADEACPCSSSESHLSGCLAAAAVPAGIFIKLFMVNAFDAFGWRWVYISRILAGLLLPSSTENPALY